MSGRGVEDYEVDTLASTEMDRETQLRIVTRVTTILPDRADHMPVLQALLAPGRPVRVRRGQGRTPEVSAARTEWLERCRTWLREEQGRTPYSTQISVADQAAYERATGDYWRLVQEGVK